VKKNELLEKYKAEATQLAKDNKWDNETIQINSKIIELDPKFTAAYTRTAKCFKEMGNYIKAFEIYEQVLEFDPDNRIAQNNLQEVKNQKEQQLCIEEDQRRVEGILSLVTTFHEVSSIANSARDKGENDLAIAAFLKAINLKPRDTYSMNNIAKIYKTIDRLTDAEQMYKQSLTIDRDNDISKVGLGAVLRKLHKFEEAENIYMEVLKKNEGNIYALNGVAGVYWDTRRVKEAEECFKKAILLNNSDIKSYSGLLKLKEFYNAIGDSNGEDRISKIIG